MPILKVIELMANSRLSWEDAARNAVEEASKTIHNIRSVYIKDHSAVVDKGVITEYRVNVNLTFEIDEHKLLM